MASGEETPPSAGRLTRLNASCPRCGSRPALRITEELAGLLKSRGSGARIGTYKCHHRGCTEIYDLPPDTTPGVQEPP